MSFRSCSLICILLVCAFFSPVQAHTLFVQGISSGGTLQVGTSIPAASTKPASHSRVLHPADGNAEAAYRALHRNHPALAERRFRSLLVLRPGDGSAMAGMGFAAMQQHNFSSALGWLRRAHSHGVRNAGIRRAINTCRFWLSIQAGNTALANGQPQSAEASARAALALKSDDPQATLLLARSLAAGSRRPEAMELYRQVARAIGTAANAEAWAGWLKNTAAMHQSFFALAAFEKLPAETRAQLRQDFEFLVSLSDANAAANHPAQAENALQDALQLSQAASSSERRQQVTMQLAWLCIMNRHYACAAQVYRKLLDHDPHNTAAWKGIVLVTRLDGRDGEAWQSYLQMPPDVRAASEKDVSFLLLLEGIEQSQGNLQQAAALLAAARKQLETSGQPVAAELLRQQAVLAMQLHQPTDAIPLYRAALSRHPDDAESWVGLLDALHQVGEDSHVLATQRQMPQSVRSSIASNSALAEAYFHAMISSEQATGHLAAALGWMDKLDAGQQRNGIANHDQFSVSLELQRGWLEYDLHRDSAAEVTAQRLLDQLASGKSATEQQRRQIVDLMANLAVRYATGLVAQGKRRGAITVLDKASQQVGSDDSARIRLATGYLTAGEPATSIAIYQSVDMRKATVGDIKAAIGAAMETERKNLAQQWLAQALADHRDDPGLLFLAGKFAQSNGNLPLAKKYLRAALAVDRAHPDSSTGQDEHHSIRTQTADLLATIESFYSNWFAATAYVNHVGGTPGTVQLIDVEIPVEAAFFLGQRMRMTMIACTVHLDSGVFSGLATLPLGTLAPGTPSAAVPMNGLGGGVQIATRSLAVGVGVTPTGFPVQNVTAFAALHAPRSPWSVSFTRDSIRESQLSYAGLRDPAQPANAWGGVIANMGSLQYARGNARSGWYANASAGAVTGRHVRTNRQVSGDVGAYWQVWGRQSAALRLGLNVYGQHNTRNELLYSYGHGGYFSPEYFLLPAVPLNLTGHKGTRLRYEFSGSLGAQVYRQDGAPWYPLDPLLESARGNPMYTGSSTVGVSYGNEDRVGYLFGEHWRVEGFFSANNAQSYNQQVGGISLHYLFRRQRFPVSRIAGAASGTAGWFPHFGPRPYLVP